MEVSLAQSYIIFHEYSGLGIAMFGFIYVWVNGLMVFMVVFRIL